MNNTVIVFESIVIGSAIKWWHFDNTITNNSDITNNDGGILITLTYSFKIFVAAINFNSLNLVI